MGLDMERKRWLSQGCNVLMGLFDEAELKDIQSKRYLHSSRGFVFGERCNKDKSESDWILVPS